MTEPKPTYLRNIEPAPSVELHSENEVINIYGDKTVSQIIEEVKYRMCNDYCRYPNEWDEEKEGKDLSESIYCMVCPLNRL